MSSPAASAVPATSCQRPDILRGRDGPQAVAREFRGGSYSSTRRQRRRPTPRGGAVMPAGKEMPSTIERSSPKAQRTWGEDARQRGGAIRRGRACPRTAFAALKHSFEKKRDRWVEKDGKGPSDPRSRRGGAAARRGEGETSGGVDYEGQHQGRALRAGPRARRREPLAHVQEGAGPRDRAQAVNGRAGAEPPPAPRAVQALSGTTAT
jgi:hypothetical protein